MPNVEIIGGLLLEKVMLAKNNGVAGRRNSDRSGARFETKSIPLRVSGFLFFRGIPHVVS